MSNFASKKRSMGNKPKALRLSALVITASMLLLLSCTGNSGKNSNDNEYRKCGGMVWNTVYNITYRGEASLADSIMPVLNGVGHSVSAFDSTSVISRINRNESDLTDSVTRRIYLASCRVNKSSGGKFDPTVGPLVTAWGFGKGHTPTADTLHIDEMLKYVGITKSRLSGDRLIKGDPRMQFNFSAIAKGYGCDAVAEMFERNGVSDYLIEIGGEIRSSGSSPRGTAWAVSIDAPVESNGMAVHESQCIINIRNMGIATSGNYRNFHAEGGSKYGHTIDPVTGRPATTDVASATVASSYTMYADAYATAVMAMGSEAAKDMANRLNLALYMVTTDGKVWVSPHFRHLMAQRD